MRDAKLADNNTRMLLRMHERLADAMRLVANDLARCTPDAPNVSWDEHAKALAAIDITLKTAEQSTAWHMRKKKPKAEIAQAAT